MHVAVDQHTARHIDQHKTIRSELGHGHFGGCTIANPVEKQRLYSFRYIIVLSRYAPLSCGRAETERQRVRQEPPPPPLSLLRYSAVSESGSIFMLVCACVLDALSCLAIRAKLNTHIKGAPLHGKCAHARGSTSAHSERLLGLQLPPTDSRTILYVFNHISIKWLPDQHTYYLYSTLRSIVRVALVQYGNHFSLECRRAHVL